MSSPPAGRVRRKLALGAALGIACAAAAACGIKAPPRPPLPPRPGADAPASSTGEPPAPAGSDLPASGCPDCDPRKPEPAR